MRTMRRPITFLLAGVVMVATVGCGSSAATTHITTGSFPTDPAAVVFRIDARGGFTSPEYQLGIVPQLTVYGDGRVIVEGPVTEQYPPHALPNLLTGTLAHSTLEALTRRAVELDLLHPQSFGSPGVSDMPTTTFTLNVSGHHRLDVYAADFDVVSRDPGVSVAELDSRKRLSTLTRALNDAATAAATEPYAPTAVAVYIANATIRGLAAPDPGAPDSGAPDSGVTPGSAVWPLGDLATLGAPDSAALSYRCAALAGADATTALAAARSATSITRWHSAGGEYTIVWRPLLPDESKCPTP